MYIQHIASLSLLVLIVSCGGSSNNTDPTPKTTVIPTINEPIMALTPLSKNAEITFEQHLKNGLFWAASNQQRYDDVPLPEAPLESFDAAVTDNQRFSTTILAETGVDETDIVKYDGNHLYIAQNNQQYVINTIDTALSSTNTVQSSIKVMQRESNGEIAQINTLLLPENDDKFSEIKGLYLANKQLTVVSETQGSYYIEPVGFAADTSLPFMLSENFTVRLFDVSTPENISAVSTFDIDGQYIESRRVDNTLYVISRYYPSAESVLATTDNTRAATYQTIQNTAIETFLPSVTDGNGVTKPLVNADNCFISETAAENDGFNEVVTITAINLQQPTQMNAICINSQVDNIYATPQSVYLYGTHYNYQDDAIQEESVIHKFSLQENRITYEASGTLNGRFGWELSNLRFSEKDNYLRVVTTEGRRWEDNLTHYFNVLEQQGNKLNLVTQLPNENSPQIIGKENENGTTNEDIKAVRYFNDKAFIVTFENTDPLYIIDVSDNTSPNISGELEIDGYSAYLHPLSDELLVGIGQNVDPNRFDDNTDERPFTEGAKITLFNVSDITQPQEVKSIVFEDAYTPAEFDYHALTYLKINAQQHRIALPLTQWQQQRVTENNTEYWQWSVYNQLSLIEINNASNGASMSVINNIESSESKGNCFSEDRSVIHEDDVYYIKNCQVWRSQWQENAATTGPY